MNEKEKQMQLEQQDKERDEEQSKEALKQGEQNATATESNDEDEGEKKYFKTAEEFDRAVSKAANSIEQRLSKELDEKLKQARDEAYNEGMKDAKLSEEELQDKKYTQRLADLEKRESELKRRHLLSDIRDVLHKKGLSSELAETFVHLGNLKDATAAIDELEKQFKEDVNEAVNERFRSKPPRASETEHNSFAASIAKQRNKRDEKQTKSRWNN